MGFEVRLATEGDAAGIVDTVHSVYDEYNFSWDTDGYCADLYDVNRYYFCRGHTFWVAEQQGRVVGTCGLERFDLIPGEFGQTVALDGLPRLCGADRSLERLYVRPEARGLGIGSALLLAAAEAARSEGRPYLEIWSDKRFESAHELYRRHGAIVVADRICDDPDHSPEWGLALPLFKRSSRATTSRKSGPSRSL